MLSVASLVDNKFNVLSAVATTFLEFTCLGVDGATSSLDQFPEILIDIYDEFKSKISDIALKKQKNLTNFYQNGQSDIKRTTF